LADGSGKEVFLAGGGLTWLYVAGSITLTNLSTEQLVGMNGNQMLLLAWWEISGFVGLMILAFIFVPIYYRQGCTTVTELLERRYEGGSIRTVISAIFLLGNILIYLPAALYSGSLFLKSMFGVDWPLLWFAAPMAIIAAIYTITGGLKAVAVMDTFSGIGVLAVAMLVVILALNAVDFDLVSGVPAERISMVGDTDSPIPFHTLFTGMLFIQIFYWSTNQNITQKAMTAPTIREAQKGVMAAAVVRILVIPVIVVVPGVVGYKLFGPMGDASYGRVVACAAAMDVGRVRRADGCSRDRAHQRDPQQLGRALCHRLPRQVHPVGQEPLEAGRLDLRGPDRHFDPAGPRIRKRQEHHQPVAGIERPVVDAGAVRVHRRAAVRQCRCARGDHRTGVRGCKLRAAHLRAVQARHALSRRDLLPAYRLGRAALYRCDARGAGGVGDRGADEPRDLRQCRALCRTGSKTPWVMLQPCTAGSIR